MIDLTRLIEGEVSVAATDLQKYSEDASIFRVMPQAIVYPKTVGDLTHLVTLVTEQKAAHPELSLTARSGGTDMSGGSLNESIILDMTRHFNHIGAFDIAGKTIVTEPGVYYRDIEAATHAQNLEIPSYPASKMICTIGGMVANNSGGEKSLRYGQTKEYVEELCMVWSDGQEHVIHPLNQGQLEAKIQEDTFEGHIYCELYQLIADNYDLIQQHKPTTSKNSAGYFLWDVWDKQRGIFNMNKLLSGSQGTLGLITKMKMRLIRPQPKSELLVMFLNDLDVPVHPGRSGT